MNYTLALLENVWITSEMQFPYRSDRCHPVTLKCLFYTVSSNYCSSGPNQLRPPQLTAENVRIMAASRRTEKCGRGTLLKAELCEKSSIISHFKQIKTGGVCGFCTHWVCSCSGTKVSLIPSLRNMIVFGLACEMKPVEREKKVCVGGRAHKKIQHV